MRNREEKNKYIRDYYKKNPEKKKLSQRKYYDKNLEKIKAISKKRREKDFEKIRERGKEYRKKYPNKNKENYNKSKKNICIICGKLAKIKYCSYKCMGQGQLGNNSNLWKGGITSINILKKLKIRQSKKYKIWRESVLKRDNYTCQRCGIIGVCLEVHHIKSFSKFADLRFNIDNGKTLCINCHKAVDKFRNRFEY